jgi:hypothetical protein
MTRITYFPNRVIDSDGIADGASIYVYQTGTTTLVSLFSDAGLSVPVANPYVLAAGAVVPPLYHSYAGNIRLYVVSDSGDVTDVDPYPLFLSDGDVTLSDIVVSTNNKVLGRVTAGSGGIEEITCTAAGRALLDDAAASDQRMTLGLATVAASGDAADLTGTLATARLPTNQTLRAVEVILDGGGVALTTGLKGFVQVPFSGTITGWTLMADQSGSIVVDVWKDTYANFPPTVADTITAADKPTISAAQMAQDLAPTGWTTAVTAGDVLAFNIDSVATVTKVTLAILITAS